MNTAREIVFTLRVAGVPRQAFPVYGNGLAVEFEQESGQQFFRRKMVGELEFIGADYNYLVGLPLDTEVECFAQLRTLHGGTVLGDVFSGHFYLTDCEVDASARSLKVTPSVSDVYGPILDGWENEYNLPRLSPQVVPLTMHRRPVLQVYIPGATAVTCIMGDSSWEQEVDATDRPQDYGFALIPGFTWYRMVSIYGSEAFTAQTGHVSMSFKWDYVHGNDTEKIDGWWLRFFPGIATWELFHDDGDGVTRPYYTGSTSEVVWPMVMTLRPTGLPGHDQDLMLAASRGLELYGRLITDRKEYGGTTAQRIPSDDFVGKNLNYRYCLGYDIGGGSNFRIEQTLSETPTEWGMSPGGQYYVRPTFAPSEGVSNCVPLARSMWDEWSVWWLITPTLSGLIDEQWRQEFTLKDSYPLYSVIQCLLREIGSEVTFLPDADHSAFLYGAGDPELSYYAKLFITPKSNVVSSDYQDPAQRGKITLRQVFEMLRDCFRCFWYVDSANRLRIEHVSFFMRGRQSSGTPNVGVDLTTQRYTRSGLAVATGQASYKYDKPDTYERLQFGWMDDVTEHFDGTLQILSGFVQKGKTEEVTVMNFSSDVDYILANPSDVSKDGFVLLGASPKVGGGWEVPFVDVADVFSQNHIILQNGYLSFAWLMRYYLYDLPAPRVEHDGREYTALGVRRLRNGEVTFPAPWVPDVLELIRTNLGDGMVRKLTYTLLDMSAKANLYFENQ